MNLMIIVLSFGINNPGPIDGFRANYSSIKIEMDYDSNSCDISLNRKDIDEDSDYVINFKDHILGHWTCDGKAESFYFSSPQDLLDRVSKEKNDSVTGKSASAFIYTPRTEGLFDGTNLFFHREDPHFLGRDPSWSTIQGKVISGRIAYELAESMGPFYCGAGGEFPHIIKAWFDGVQPERGAVLLSGRNLEYEIYMIDDHGKKWKRLEVFYDPSIGFLPRKTRLMSYDFKSENMNCVDYYLLKAHCCTSGGFAPINYISDYVVINKFFEKFPNYNHLTNLISDRRTVNGIVFKVTNIRDLHNSSSLTHLDGVKMLGSIGGAIKIESKSSKLSIDDLKSRIGRKLIQPQNHLLPNIDVDELNDAKKQSVFAWHTISYVFLSITILLVVVVILRRMKIKLLLLFIILSIAETGCERIGDPVNKVSAAYNTNLVYINPDTHEVEMTMIVRNDGNQTLNILGADGGCSCRKVDQAGFPRVLKPGNSIPLHVTLSVSPITTPQSSQFSFSTDHGNFSVNLPYFTIVSHQFDPDVVATNALNEQDEWIFDFTHRYIYRADDGQVAIHPTFPDVLTVVKMNERRGKLNGAEDYAYTDTTYRLSLKDHSLGMHKSVITLRNSDGRVIHETPVVWNRVPYLSTAPERVAIASRPVRVFLRCPDDQVELLKVLSVPKGVKAVITSTRELTVTLDENPPEILRGEIEVQTSAQGHPPLKFIVVRYAPSHPKLESKPSI